jgi:hypothetical protein
LPQKYKKTLSLQNTTKTRAEVKAQTRGSVNNERATNSQTFLGVFFVFGHFLSFACPTFAPEKQKIG